jgi:hypothetical protein
MKRKMNKMDIMLTFLLCYALKIHKLKRRRRRGKKRTRDETLCSEFINIST